MRTKDFIEYVADDLQLHGFEVEAADLMCGRSKFRSANGTQSFIVDTEGIFAKDFKSGIWRRHNFPRQLRTSVTGSSASHRSRPFPEEARQRVAALNAQRAFAKFSTAGVSGYAARKQMNCLEGLRFDRTAIVAPIFNKESLIQSLLYILEDGTKLFFPVARRAEGYFLFGDEANSTTIFIVEGLATGSSCFQAIGTAIFVAFCADNLSAVARMLRLRHPSKEIVILGDEDRWSQRGNIGRKKATSAALECRGKAVFPAFADLSTKPTDFNDLHCIEGIQIVKHQLENLIK